LRVDHLLDFSGSLPLHGRYAPVDAWSAMRQKGREALLRGKSPGKVKRLGGHVRAKACISGQEAKSSPRHREWGKGEIYCGYGGYEGGDSEWKEAGGLWGEALGWQMWRQAKRSYRGISLRPRLRLRLKPWIPERTSRQPITAWLDADRHASRSHWVRCVRLDDSTTASAR
jgi:hypothetical protein